MELVYIVALILIGLWAISVAFIGLYVWFKIMPVVRVLRETHEGQKQVTKAVFPPRFHR